MDSSQRKLVQKGKEWFRKDWEDENFLCSKLATQFVVGAQLGWFSIIGISDPDFDQSCGPMGVGDLLLSDKHANFVKFMKTIAIARRQAIDYVVDGSLSLGHAETARSKTKD